MKYKVINQKGNNLKTKTSLPEEIFGVELNKDLLYQVVVSQQANKRHSTAHTKTRGEVRGGGKKPWRQKGLGRARHGSIRSPIWIGGGTTFGPRNEKNYKKRIPKKMKRKALFMALSSKVNDKTLIIVNKLEIEKAKTKLAANIFNKIIEGKNKSLVVLPELDKNLILAIRNIPYLKTIQAKDLNCLTVLRYKNVIMPKDSIDVIKKVFLKK
jgi:large subunit ribosomal protein L4